MPSKWTDILLKSGPGWIQAAVTLGGGTLVSALYLGVIGGYQFLWLQPLAMLAGVVMLAGLSYITLSHDHEKDRPFTLARRHISPILAWAWLIAAMIANIVFCAAQFALASDALSGNLGVEVPSPYIITAVLAVLSMIVLSLFIDKGKFGLWIDKFIKVLVSVILLCFMIVVVILFVNGAVDVSGFLKGWIPRFDMLFSPATSYADALAETSHGSIWEQIISSEQRNIIIGAFGTAVGINMTFLLPYSQMKKGWKRSDRKFAVIDLFMGLLIPFVIGASCLIIATASQFHAKSDTYVNETSFNQVMDNYLSKIDADYAAFSPSQKTTMRSQSTHGDQRMATMLARRDARDLATSLAPLLGRHTQLIFGIGILAMAFSTMIVHMMINGYALSEAFGQPGQRRLFLYGAAIPACSGFLSPIIWAGSIKTAVIVPASVIATTLLPIAYLIIYLLSRDRKLASYSGARPMSFLRGFMVVALAISYFAAIWALLGFTRSTETYRVIFGYAGLVTLSALTIVGLIGHIKNTKADS